MCKKILIIVPDDLMRATLRVILSGDGHQVQTSGDLGDASRRLGNWSFDVVFAHAYGSDAAAELIKVKLQHPKLRLVLFASSSSYSQVSAGAVVLQRPFSLSDIRAAVIGTTNESVPGRIGESQSDLFSSFLRMTAKATRALTPINVDYPTTLPCMPDNQRLNAQ
jgi:DNA-binding NtrC family response regulator